MGKKGTKKKPVHDKKTKRYLKRMSRKGKSVKHLGVSFHPQAPDEPKLDLSHDVLTAANSNSVPLSATPTPMMNMDRKPDFSIDCSRVGTSTCDTSKIPPSPIPMKPVEPEPESKEIERSGFFKIFVRNVLKVPEAELKAIFAEFGRVLECRVINTLGLVYMEDEIDGRNAVSLLNGMEAYGQVMIVEESKVKDKGPDIPSIFVKVTNLRTLRGLTPKDLKTVFMPFGLILSVELTKVNGICIEGIVKMQEVAWVNILKVQSTGSGIYCKGVRVFVATIKNTTTPSQGNHATKFPTWQPQSHLPPPLVQPLYPVCAPKPPDPGAPKSVDESRVPRNPYGWDQPTEDQLKPRRWIDTPNDRPLPHRRHHSAGTTMTTPANFPSNSFSAYNNYEEFLQAARLAALPKDPIQRIPIYRRNEPVNRHLNVQRMKSAKSHKSDRKYEAVPPPMNF